MSHKIVTIFGGSGFLGRYVVKQLSDAGYRIKIVSLNPYQGRYLKPAGTTGQINIVYGNIRNVQSVKANVKGSDIVINLVGILHSRGKKGFSSTHARGAEYLAKACAEEGVERLVHVSALGIDKPSGSRYARSKLNGEKAILNAYSNATILRPSIIFGQEDNFFNKFAFMTRYLPFLPLIGGGKTLFQPIYVDDVATAIIRCLQSPATQGHIYELGGPTIYSFKQLMQLVLRYTGKKRLLLPIPYVFASLISVLMSVMSQPPLSHDQVKLLKVNNIVSSDMPGLKDLGIEPKPLEAIVPYYIH